jgi:hypothetical protein
MLPMVHTTGETAKKPLPATMTGGFAVFDYDNDGLLDLYFSNGGVFPAGRKSSPAHSNRLFRNHGGMRFADTTNRAGVAGKDYAFGAAAADFDNDGRVDLLVSELHGVTLYRNLGGGSFEDVTSKAGLDNRGRWAVASAWLDFDNDGDLDLFVGNYVEYDPATERTCLVNGKPDFCHPKYYPATSNALFLNRGNGTFDDVSEAVGLNAHKGKAMSLAVADFDGNGYADVFVTNDRLFNSLFLNRGGQKFEEAAFEWGVAVPGDGNPPSSMGADAQDIDRDGRPELTYAALRDETFPLYWNTGKGFADRTAASRMSVLSRPMSGWAILFADLDNDGWQDILAARSDALSASGGRAGTAKEPPAWFRNLGNSRFAAGPGWEGLPKAMYRGAMAADLNNDGCLDVILTALQEPPRILWNPCPAGARWLAVDVRQPGARVRVGEQWRIVSSASGYSSSYAGPQHFGLGEATEADVEVVWPGGRSKRLGKVAAGRRVKVEP